MYFIHHFKTYFVAIIILVTSISCGLPDDITVLSSPTVLDNISSKTISGSSITNKITSFGISFYYKFYTSTSPSNDFNTDYSSWLTLSSTRPETIASSKNFFLMTLSSRSSSLSSILPVLSLDYSNNWAVIIKYDSLSTGFFLTGSGLSNVALNRQLFRSGSTVGVQFQYDSAANPAIYQTGDSDLVSQLPTGSIYVGVVGVLTGYDTDNDYTWLYSAPFSLGLYQVK